MRVIHFAPFAPNGCGLYEAARDMIIADRINGHDADCVDTGCFSGGTMTTAQGRIGLKDERGGTVVETVAPIEARDADILVCHTGVPDPWITPTQAPIAWVLHGRPLACFRPEQNNPASWSYSLMCQVAQWPRVKALVTMWPEHVPYWKMVLPNDKIKLLSAPPCDQRRFCIAGTKWAIPETDRGDFNVLVADSWREDVDIFEIVHGIELASRHIDGLKLHIFAAEHQERCWKVLLDALRLRGCLGHVCGRVPSMQMIYRAVDCVVTPHRITTRIINEAMSCGTPVVAAFGNQATKYGCSPESMETVSDAIQAVYADWSDDKPKLIRETLATAEEMFALDKIGGEMSDIYDEMTGGNVAVSFGKLQTDPVTIRIGA